MNTDQSLFEDVRSLLENARNKAYEEINSNMLNAYWRIGKRIVMEERKAKEQEKFTDDQLKEISKELERELGRGPSVNDLKKFREFYLAFPAEQMDNI